MKRTRLAIAALALAAATPAHAQLSTIGQTMANACYSEARYGRAGLESLRICDLALHDENMTRRNRIASYINRGVVHLNGNETAAAMSDFDAALQLRPDLAEGHINRGNAFIQRGDYNAAIEAINRGLGLNPEEPARAYYSRARAYEESGQLRAAYADYRRAADLAPRWDLPRLQLTRFSVRR